MKKIKLSLASGDSVVYCGEGVFEEYSRKVADGRQIFIVTDSNVNKLYGNLVSTCFCDAEVKVIPAGERSKNPGKLLEILDRMMKSGMRRDSLLIAFGGGVVGDIAGLAASLYMRGAEIMQIPTTLLAQVDSSVGGKTAVDFKGVKNVIGTFYQPKTVVADPMFFKTLPKKEIRCGLGEVVKYGALDEYIYEKLLKNISRLYSVDFLGEIVYDCIRHKAAVVQSDERDVNGVRKTLNLGHTTGHAFELFYGGASHGDYVLIGMYYELLIAVKRGICGGQYAENLKKLILKVKGKIPVYEDIQKAAELAVYDKKNEKGLISLIVPRAEGKTEEIRLTLGEYIAELEEAVGELR